MSFQPSHTLSELLDALEQTLEDPGDLASTLKHIAQTAQLFFDADACVIFAINPITGRFITSLTTAGDLLVGEVPFEQPRPWGLTQQVLKQGILLVEDLEKESEYHSTFTRSEEVCSFAALALQMRNHHKPLGVLYLNFRQPRQFSSSDQALLQLFAERASFILQETWLLQRYQEVARIGKEINHELSTVDALFQRMPEQIATILDASYALLLAVYQQQTDTIDIYAEDEGRTLLLKNDPLEGACKYVLETQQTLFVQQLSKVAGRLPFQNVSIEGTRPVESLIFVPLVLRDVPLGTLSIQHPEADAYDHEDLAILQLLANHIASALHNIRLYDDLRRLNETGLLLTQQLDAEQTLQATVDRIREVTEADVVILYPYQSTQQRFLLPPRVSGDLFTSHPQFLSPSKPDGITTLALRYKEPIFAKDGISLYSLLQGKTKAGGFGQSEKLRSTAVMPLRVGEEPVGVLFVNFRKPQPFKSPQKLLIEGLGHYAAIAIKNALAFGSLIQRRIHELEILQHIDRELTRTLELEPMLNTLLRLANEHVPAEEVSILLYNSKTCVLETAAAIGRHAETSRMQKIPLQGSRGITRWVLEHRQPVRVGNVHQDPVWQDLHLRVADDTVSELDVPLLDGDEAVGVLNFESVKEGVFSQEDQDFLVTLSGQAVLAIKNAQAFERERRLVEETRALNEISKEINSHLDPDYVFNLILEKALEVTNSTRGNLMIYDPEQDDLWMAAERGVVGKKIGMRQSLEEGIVGYVAKHKKLLNVDLTQRPWRDVNLDLIPGTRSELAVPMLSGSDLRGVLNIESLSSNFFTDRDERLLVALADLAVIALQNAQAYEREKWFLEEARVLTEIGKELTSQLDPNHVFDLILENALKLTDSTMGNLMLYDPEQDDLWMAAEHGVDPRNKGQRQSLNQGIVGYVARTQQLLNVDLSEPPWNEVYVPFIPGAHSELAVPLLAGDEVLGVLNIESTNRGNFSEKNARLLQGLADLAVVALKNAGAYERERHLLEEARVLNEISKQITRQLDPNHVFDLILENAMKLTDSSVGSLHLYEPDLGYLRMATEQGVVEGKKNMRQSLEQGIVGYVAKHQRSLNIPDVTQPPWNEVYIEFFPGIRSELAIPMLEGNNLRGVLNVESPSLRHFSESDERLLQGLADLAVVALQNAERYERAEKEAQHFELLYQAGQELSKIADLGHLEQAYDIIVQIAEQHSRCQVVIRRYEANTQELVLVRVSQHQTLPPFPRMKLDEGLNGIVARERRTIVIYDTANPPARVVVKLSDPATQSLAVVPIYFKDRYYGNLALGHEEVAHFRGSDISFFEGLANQLASTIYRLETAQERQEFEQIAKSAEEMSSIGQSAYEVTHRLGNDLGLVNFYIRSIRSELEKQGLTNAQISKNLDNIGQSAQRVLSFSRDLKKELAKLSEEQAPGEPVLIAPRDLFEKAIAALSFPPNVQVKVDIDAGVKHIRVIFGQVDDIILNLIANAIQAMPPEGGKITLHAHNAGRAVALEVVDTGTGISPEKLSKIFDLFFSTRGSSGFGLWSARRIALKNQGNLKVESKPGRGTIFTLLLPGADEQIPGDVSVV